MSKFLFLLAALCAAMAARAGVNIEHWIAPSGARVYFLETRALPILDVQIDFSAGAAYAPAGKAGLASVTRELLETGAGDMDEERIAARLVDLGARLSGSADDDRAGLALRTLSGVAERSGALELLRTVVSAPTFPEAPFAREKARIIAALQEAETRPDSIAARRFAAAIYPGHPYGTVATPESVAAITREDVLAFYRNHYSAQRAVVSIIGDVTRAEAETIAADLTSALPAGVAESPLPAVTWPGRATIKVAHPASQSHIHVGLPAVRRGDPDFFPLLVGNYVLGGGGFVSRLMKEVREKRGYAYGVYSYFAPKKLEGPFEIGLQTKRSQAGEAIKVVEDTLTGFISTGPNDEELKAAKRNLADGLALRIDSNAKLLGYLAVIGFYGLPLDYLDRFAEKVNAVTAQQVRDAFARHVRREHMVTVIVAAD